MEGDRQAPAVDRTVWWFRAFLLAHVLIWPIVLTLTRPSPSLDQVEMVFWGHEWRIGYTKHPPLPSWIVEAVAVATGRSLWAQYLLPHLALVLAFWAVWRLARRMVSPRRALLAVCLLECIPCYSIGCHQLNNNVGLFPCWALAVLFLWRAMETDRGRDWLATGLWLALGMLTKYTTVILAATMVGFAVAHPQARRLWRRPGPYLATAVALLLFLPHAWWVAVHGFATITYAISHVAGSHRWTGYLLNPLQFLGGQLVMLALMAVVALVAARGRIRLRPAAADERFPRAFLTAMALGPMALHLAISAAGNLSLRDRYGEPLWLFTGLLAVLWWEIRPEAPGWRRTWIVWAAAVVGLGLGASIAQVAQPFVLGRSSRSLMPARELAAAVDRAWRTRYHCPLPIVAGDYFLAGSVAFFAADRPRVYESTGEVINDTAIHDCPWLSDDEFRRQGGVILWDRDADPKGLPREVLRRFHVRETVELPPLAYLTRAKLLPLRISLAIVPPQP